MSFAEYSKTLFGKLVASNFEPIQGLTGDEITYATPIIGLVSITGSMWYAVAIINTNIIDNETYKNATRQQLNTYFESLLGKYGKKNIVVLNLFVSEKSSDYVEFLNEDNFEFDRPVINAYWEMRLYDKALTIGYNHPDKIANLKELAMDSLDFSNISAEEGNTTDSIYERAVVNRPRLEARGDGTSLSTFILIIVNMMIHASITFSGASGFNLAIEMGALIPWLVTETGQYYRLFTSMFLHVNFMHLINNCFSLYIFGTRAEKYYGGFKFILIYILSGIFGGIVSVIFVPNPTVGASGAVFGLLGAVLALTVKSKADAEGLNYPIMLVLAGTSLSLGFMRPEINNHAHIGGLVTGFVLGFLLYRSERHEN